MRGVSEYGTLYAQACGENGSTATTTPHVPGGSSVERRDGKNQSHKTQMCELPKSLRKTQRPRQLRLKRGLWEKH